MIRRALVLTVILVPLTFAIAACGDDEDEDSTAAEETTTEETASGGGGDSLAVSETEFALDPQDATAAAGPVTIDVTNDGETVHNLEVEGEGVEEITADLQPGDSDTLELDLEPGSYEWYCAIGDHAAQGMEGELTVE